MFGLGGGKAFSKSSLVLLITSLVLTLTTMGYSMAVSFNIFSSDDALVNINDGEPIIGLENLYLVPGTVASNNFFIENLSSSDIYFTFYFDNLKGELAEIVEISILSDSEVLQSGRITQLSKDNAGEAELLLLANERKIFTIDVSIPADAPNDVQSKQLTFDFIVVAVSPSFSF